MSPIHFCKQAPAIAHQQTQPIDVAALIGRLRRANDKTKAFESARASGKNKYMRVATSTNGGDKTWLSPFKDVFGDKMELDSRNFALIPRPDKAGVHECDRTVFDACDELVHSIWPSLDVSKMVVLEVRDKYVSNVMPRILLIACPDKDPLIPEAADQVFGVKDDGTVFQAFCDDGSLKSDGPKFAPLRKPARLSMASGDEKERLEAVEAAKAKAVGEILGNVWGKELWMDALDTQFAQIGKNVLEHYLDYNGIFQTEMKTECRHLLEEFKQRSLYTDMIRTSVNPMKVWSAWSDKKVYKKAIYDPSRPKLDEGGDVFNLFTGWGVEPTAPNDPSKPCPHIMRHLNEVMSSSNPQHFRFWLDALATWVRNPSTKLECAFGMRCRKGVGKGAWWEVIKRMWGIHSVEIVDQTHLTGRFNSHLQGKSAVALNEAVWGGSHQANSKLLSMITDPDFLHEAKHGKPSMMVNYWVVFIMANADWFVPASSDNRRFFLPTISECHRGDKAYFDEYFASLDVEVPEFLHYLLRMHKITPNFRPGSAIQAMGNSDEGVNQLVQGNANFLTKWVKQGLEAGSLKVGGEPKFFTQTDPSLFRMDKPTVVPSELLIARFETELANNHKLRKAENRYLVPRSIDKNMLSRMFRSLFGPTVYKSPVWRKNAKDPVTGKNTAFWFATVGVLREAFAKHALNAPAYSWQDAASVPLGQAVSGRPHKFVGPLKAKMLLQQLCVRRAWRRLEAAAKKERKRRRM